MEDELGIAALNRRRLLGTAGAAGALLAGGSLLAGCSGDDDDTDAAPNTTSGDGSDTTGGGGGDNETAVDLVQDDLPQIDWEMTTSWPAGLATLFGTEDNGVGAVGFAQLVGELSGGRFTIQAFQAGELAGALEVIDVLQSGAVPAGHTASYYYNGKSPAFAFGTAVPFGLTYRQQFSWLYYYRDDQGRSGLDMLREFYANEYNVINFPAGNTGCQMGGFFNREITSLDDLQGIVMRIPGLGGEIMTRLGVTTQNLAGGEIAQALQTNAIDAAEFVGPYDDNTLGLGEAGDFYYYPGWWEPGATLDVFVSLDAYNELPDEYKGILEIAAQLSYLRMMGYYDSIQPYALAEIEADGAELRAFPDDVMAAAQSEAETLLDELAAEDQNFATILEHWRPYRDAVQPWHGTAELSMLRAGAGE
ncbi:MAG: ABC transporter substrate-binding protein [Actinomycetota bacterium]|nr:ABC transporter substrate-binding protein [Actinomycetota bacterium]